MKDSQFILIPKYEEYVEYVFGILLKLPRTEKFNIGNVYKNSLYEGLKTILYIAKKVGKDKEEYINIVDTELVLQRIYLRIMYDNHWIDSKKFAIAIRKISEIGKIIGGLLKYYGKMDTK